MGALVICRNETLRRDYRVTFHKKQCLAIMAADGMQGLRELKWFTPNVIIWELEQVSESAYKLLTHLRSNYKSVPIVLVVAASMMKDSVLSTHATLMLENDVDVTEVVTQAIAHIDEPSTRTEPSRRGPWGSSREESLSEFDNN